jgi:hypothetical protein
MFSLPSNATNPPDCEYFTVFAAGEELSDVTGCEFVEGAVLPSAFDSEFICFSFPNLGVEMTRIFDSITMSRSSVFYRVQLCYYFKAVLEALKTGAIGGLAVGNCGIFAGRDEGI